MTEAVTTATATLGLDLGGVLAARRAGRDLTLVAGVGLPLGAVGTYRVALDESANAGFSLGTGEPTIVEDMAIESRFKVHPTLRGSASSAASACPSAAATSRSGS